jgi:nucleotide-binding universal stress UspA family protein
MRSSVTYKTILICLKSGVGADALLNIGIELATKYDAHLLCLYIASNAITNPPDGKYIPVEAITSPKDYALEEAARNRALFEQKTSKEDLSAEWRLLEASVSDIVPTIVKQSRMADLVVIRQADVETDDYRLLEMPGEVVMASGRPVLVIPATTAVTSIGKTIVLAWNGTREASRAAFDALPFLQDADEAVLLGAVSASRDDGSMRDSKNEFAEILTRHGAKVSAEPPDHRQDITDGEMLLSCVAKHGADLLVMGAYGHSRTREFILGGATKHVLALTTVPVLMSH